MNLHLPHQARLLIFATFLSCCIFFNCSANATDYYIDGIYGNDNNAGGSSAPFQNVWRGIQYANPGDTIHLRPSTVYGHIGMGKSGAPGQYITITGDGPPGNLTQVSGQGTNFGVDIYSGVSYVRVQNLDVTAPGSWSAIFVSTSANNILINNNYTHDSGCSGIMSVGADYVQIASNTVTRNSNNTAGGHTFCSGISLGFSIDIDASTAQKMLITKNLVYNNSTSPDCLLSGCKDTDGNGIILDDNRRTEKDNMPYHGGIMVENNLVVGNGGRGIHDFSSDNVTIRANTLYRNNQMPGSIQYAWRPSEIEVWQAGGTMVANNIAYTDGIGSTTQTGGHMPFTVMNCTSGAPIIVTNNIAYNSMAAMSAAVYTNQNSIPVSYSTSDVTADPLFKYPAFDLTLAQFEVTQYSPAIGVASIGLSPGDDLLGVARPKPNGPITAGAYQTPVQ